MIKKILVFSFVISIFGICLSSYILLSKKQKDKILQKNTLALQKNIQSFKSPCREMTNKDIFQKNKSKLTRVNKLNRLMEQPIDWMFKDIKGEVIDLYCYRNKKKVLINLWATWCPPCIEELPSLSQLSGQSSQYLATIAITTEPLGIVKKFISESFSDLNPQLKIVKMTPEQLSRYFPKDSLPTSYIFNQQGQLEDKIIGARDWLKYKN